MAKTTSPFIRISHRILTSGRIVLLAMAVLFAGSVMQAETYTDSDIPSLGDINESVEFNISGAPTYSGVISDTSETTPTTVTKTGDGKLTLNGANTYTGSTTISSGTLAIQNNFTTSSVLLGSGTLEFSKHDIFFNIGSASNFTGTVQVVNDGSNPTRTKLGDGSAAVTIDLSKATVEINGAGSAKYSELAFTKGGSNLTIGTLNGNAYCRILTTVNEDNCDLIVYKGNYAGIIGRSDTTGNWKYVNNVNLIKAYDSTVEDGGTLELSGKNYYFGTTKIKGGTLKLTGNGSLGSGAVSLETNTGTLEFAHTSDQTIANNISGAGNVVRSGSGVVTLTGDLTYTGTTTINDGTTLQIVNNNTGYKYFTASTALTGSGTLALAGTGDWIGFSINSTTPQEFTGTVNVSGNVMIRAKSSTKPVNLSNGTLHLDGGATVGLFVNKSGSNVNVSPLTVKELNTETGSTIRLCNTDPGEKFGLLTVGSGTVNGNLGEANPTSAHLYFNRVNLVKVSDGSEEGGTLTVNGNNYYTGTTTIQAGTLKLTGSGTLGTGAVSFVQEAESTNIGTLEFAHTSDKTFNNDISGVGNVTKSESGVVTLGGALAYTGTTTINDGTIVVKKDFTSSSGLDGVGTLKMSGNELYFAVSDSLNSENSQPSFAGTIQLNDSTISEKSRIKLGVPNGNSFNAANVSLPKATLEINGNSTGKESELALCTGQSSLTIGTLNGNAYSRILQIQPSAPFQYTDYCDLTVSNGNYAGEIGRCRDDDDKAPNGLYRFANLINLIKASDGSDDGGTLELSGTNYYFGTTTIQGGTLKLTGSGTLGTGATTIAQDAKLDFAYEDDREDPIVFTSANAISGAGQIVKSGSGVLKIDNINSPNTISADSFVVNAGELDFKGYFEGNIEIINGAVFSPGNSVGTLSVTGDFAVTDGTALFEFGTYTGEDENHDVLYILGENNTFIAGDGMISLSFSDDSPAETWAVDGKEYLLIPDAGFATGDKSLWLSNYTDLFSLTGKSDGLYLTVGAAPVPGVPEPSTWALLVLGVAALFLRKRVRS